MLISHHTDHGRHPHTGPALWVPAISPVIVKALKMKRKKPRLYWASFNYLELQLPADVVTSCSHSGRCGADVSAALQLPIIADQLAKIAPETLVKELREYGAWSAEDLQDHEQNKARIVWIAANDISEEHKDFKAR